MIHLSKLNLSKSGDSDLTFWDSGLGSWKSFSKIAVFWLKFCKGIEVARQHLQLTTLMAFGGWREKSNTAPSQATQNLGAQTKMVVFIYFYLQNREPHTTVRTGNHDSHLSPCNSVLYFLECWSRWQLLDIESRWFEFTSKSWGVRPSHQYLWLWDILL